MVSQQQLFSSEKEACSAASVPEAEHQATGQDAATTTTAPQTSAGTAARAVSVLDRNVIIAALGVAVFVSTLDARVVATLVPSLTDEFKSANSVGWYGTAYCLLNTTYHLLVVGATQPSWGKIYANFHPKIVFLVSVALLEAGSLTCALAKDSPTFIGGRAVAGLGAAGIISGAFVWAFWINLPIGASLGTALFLLFHPPRSESNTAGQQSKTILCMLEQIDVLGGMLIAGSFTCLFLALQWGGSDYAWSSGRIVALLVLPLWFQAVHGLSPLESGIQTLAMVISVICVARRGSGCLCRRLSSSLYDGSYHPHTCGCPAALHHNPGNFSGFLSWVSDPLRLWLWNGCLIGHCRLSACRGSCRLHTERRLRSCWSIRSVARYSSAFLRVFFMSDITRLANVLPDVNRNTLGSGFESVRMKLSPEELEVVISGYNHGIQRVFLMVLVLWCLTVLIWPLVKWTSIKLEANERKDTTP
ncbi:Major facilitator superfamily transporter [Tolypocladium capitatum]|uniref:Major facilitator superfamily transporter n=1 Tax=Tolypocladium capitatum TaxID=45235 RepID=A0A2K3QM59_9HYPO|nr:Major facilitator superfamily transporter [Tolypocladium capitatum]